MPNTHLSKMEQIPNELLLDVSERVSTKDLCELSLVCKKLRAVAQEVLHRSPVIPMTLSWDLSTERCKLSSLLWTFVKRPDLALLVRELELRPLLLEVDFDYSILCDSTQRDQALLRSARLKVSEMALAGMILERVPHLIDLHLEVANYFAQTCHKYDMVRYAHLEAIELLFDEKNSSSLNETGYRRDLTKIAGLRGLKKLHLEAAELQWPWAALPSLREIHVNRLCALTDVGTPLSATSHSIRTLTLERNTSILRRQSVDQPIISFLGRLNGLSKVVVSLSNYIPFNREGTLEIVQNGVEEPSCDWLLMHLSGVAVTLRALEINIAEDEHEDGCFLQYVRPASAFSFRKLQHLKLPHELLAPVHEDFQTSGDIASLAPRMLPSSLKTLDVTYPFLAIGEYMQGICDNENYFQDLKKIGIDTRGSRGDGRMKEFYDLPTWNELTGRGITLAM
ncbi:hypothetical protein BDV96DRAFT_608268 [Lophiotrema nucula]|uniref:F-box domain-containing protein n=1 Tax=Lophiotrema nucula TaxID=690887 RepID=A0A6A5YDS6_9PLEO|nr:hypothetical protein BDV96DRAFT_608268 [Lophiotrema nucula]